ncbi:hypothetical protein NPIL_527751 [Nephila pilipes]|uniref:Uncharacterized protein n=1 Tax=Nephila pilipes TaxID=299642 RepID=A0A8X6PB74_NEPPI|nr:hypothetical protein NPIL_527751 [Nephila pilipes]
MLALPKKTYSSILAPFLGKKLNEPPRKTSCCSDIITAENCNSSDVRKLFRAQVNHRKEKIGIQHVKEISDNRILVNCASEEDRDKLMTVIEANPKFLKPTVPKRKFPTMMIRNVPNDVAHSKLQNDSFELKILSSDRDCDCSAEANIFNTKRVN